MDIRELTEAAEFREVYRLLTQLHAGLDDETVAGTLSTMRDQGYRLFGLYVDEDLRAVAGVTVITNFSNGKHVYLYDLVTDEPYRSRGYGAELLRFIERWGDERGCSCVKLVARIDDDRAHEFYEQKMGYRRTGYVFKSEHPN